LPEPCIPLTADQFSSAIREADLELAINGLQTAGEAFAEIDFSNRKAVGSLARVAVEQFLDQIEEILGLTGRLARLAPVPPANSLREETIERGTRAAELSVALIELLRSPTYLAALETSERVKQTWDRFIDRSGFDEALERCADFGESDLNARVSLALGRTGDFTDPDGAIDPSRVLLTFSPDPDPLASIAAAVSRYFAPLLENNPLGRAEGASLVGPLVLLASSECPLTAHNVADFFSVAIRDAYKRDPETTKELIKRSAAEGPTIYAALSRVERAFTGLKKDMPDEESVDRIMRSYHQLAESAFRATGFLALGLEDIGAGRKPAKSHQPPMLGDLTNRLSAGSELGRILATGIDVNLRNAEAHVQYRWVPEKQVVRDWRTDQEWNVDQLFGAFHRLLAVIAGADSASTCFVLAAGLTDLVPDWVASGDVSEVFSLLANVSFGPRGLDVREVSADGGSIVIGNPDQADQFSMMPALAGFAPFAPKASEFKVEGPTGNVLAQVRAETMAQYPKVNEDLQSFVVIALNYESAVNADLDPTRGADEFAALAMKCLVGASERELVDTSMSPQAFQNIMDRANYLDFLFKAKLGPQISEVQRERVKVRKISRAATKAIRGDQAARENLTRQLGRLAEEAEKTDTTWPPSARGGLAHAG
jgi:molybdopterin converting factor small subunit